MDVTEQARRSDALHYDAISRRELCNIVARVEAENARLRVLAAKMAKALGVKSIWCNRDCMREFHCHMRECPIDEALQELGIETDE